MDQTAARGAVLGHGSATLSQRVESEPQHRHRVAHRACGADGVDHRDVGRHWRTWRIYAESARALSANVRKLIQFLSGGETKVLVYKGFRLSGIAFVSKKYLKFN